MPLANVAGIRLISLQTGDVGAHQLADADPSRKILDAGPHLRSFADTAALLDRLDLLVTVDTAAAHLAGAMGRPVWTLLAHTPDWRWHLKRLDSPWYPTMRLFRQPIWGNWDAVVDTVAQALRKPGMEARRREGIH
jgi:ADP-heptose:LPS heptosyltransferase